MSDEKYCFPPFDLIDLDEEIEDGVSILFPNAPGDFSDSDHPVYEVKDNGPSDKEKRQYKGDVFQHVFFKGNLMPPYVGDTVNESQFDGTPWLISFTSQCQDKIKNFCEDDLINMEKPFCSSASSQFFDSVLNNYDTFLPEEHVDSKNSRIVSKAIIKNMENNLPKKNYNKVLIIGAGKGADITRLSRIARISSSSEIICVEPNEQDASKIISTNDPSLQIRLFICDFSSFIESDIDKKFDLIVLNNTAHYAYADHKYFLNLITSWLLADGYVVGCFPSYESMHFRPTGGSLVGGLCAVKENANYMLTDILGKKREEPILHFSAWLQFLDSHPDFFVDLVSGIKLFPSDEPDAKELLGCFQFFNIRRSLPVLIDRPLREKVPNTVYYKWFSSKYCQSSEYDRELAPFSLCSIAKFSLSHGMDVSWVYDYCCVYHPAKVKPSWSSLFRRYSGHRQKFCGNRESPFDYYYPYVPGKTVGLIPLDCPVPVDHFFDKGSHIEWNHFFALRNEELICTFKIDGLPGSFFEYNNNFYLLCNHQYYLVPGFQPRWKNYAAQVEVVFGELGVNIHYADLWLIQRQDSVNAIGIGTAYESPSFIHLRSLYNKRSVRLCFDSLVEHEGLVLYCPSAYPAFKHNTSHSYYVKWEPTIDIAAGYGSVKEYDLRGRVVRDRPDKVKGNAPINIASVAFTNTVVGVVSILSCPYNVLPGTTVGSLISYPYNSGDSEDFTSRNFLVSLYMRGVLSAFNFEGARLEDVFPLLVHKWAPSFLKSALCANKYSEEADDLDASENLVLASLSSQGYVDAV